MKVHVVAAEQTRAVVIIDITDTQRLVLRLAPYSTDDVTAGFRPRLTLFWERRPSDRYKWGGPNVESRRLGYVGLNTNTFEAEA